MSTAESNPLHFGHRRRGSWAERMHCGEEAHEPPALDQGDQCPQPCAGAGGIASAHPAAPSRFVEIVLGVDAVGAAVTADKDVEPQVDLEQRVVAARHQRRDA